MRRREALTLLSVTAAWPLVARAQQAARIRRIGVLTGFSEGDAAGQSLLAAFQQQLTTLGWNDGRNIHFEIRWGNAADPKRLDIYALELARMMPDVIVVHGARALEAVRRKTDRVPMLFASVSDPVASGYVASLARPGGNITGFTNYDGVPTPKLLEALKDLAPSIARVAFMITPDNRGMPRHLQAIESAAGAFAVKVTGMLLRDQAMIIPTIAAFAQEPNGGLVVASDVFMITHRARIIAAAAQWRLPAVYQDRSFVVDGGLMSYSVDRRKSYRRVAIYVDRILRGAKPADLPVQQPEKFDFALNLKAARALGLDVPRILLARADEVID